MTSIELKIRRTEKTEGKTSSFWQDFTIPVSGESTSLLDGLIWLQQNLEPSLSFRFSCRVGMCGTCGVIVNGKESLACRTLLHPMATQGIDVKIEPMRHLPVIRDLVTDMSGFQSKLQKAASFNTSGGVANSFTALSPDSQERKAIDPQRECIYCGLCYSACTIVGLNDNFLGPAALNRAFVALLDSRNTANPDGVEAIANEDGLWRCHTIFDCTAVCPKGISPTVAIQSLKKKVIGLKIKRFLRVSD